jgi:hypothetical protein
MMRIHVRAASIAQHEPAVASALRNAIGIRKRQQQTCGIVSDMRIARHAQALSPVLRFSAHTVE